MIYAKSSTVEAIEDLKNHTDFYVFMAITTLESRLKELLKYPERLAKRKAPPEKAYIATEKPDPAVWVKNTELGPVFGHISYSIASEYLHLTGHTWTKFEGCYYWKREGLAQKLHNFLEEVMCVEDTGDVNYTVVHPLLKKIKSKKKGTELVRKLYLKKSVYTIPAHRLPGTNSIPVSLVS